ncbi:MAG TPA: phosphatase PAP2 family protein [Bryobacteraceae bacterium]|nr:phosphatase PAP2 family protein [Bryobacteraceae bacterium]
MSVSEAVARLSTPDYRLARRVNRWRPPRWIRWWMILATRGGDGWMWGLLGVILLCRFDRQDYVTVSAAGCAAFTGVLLFRFLKNKVGRPRPCVHEPSCWATLTPPDQFSFPSGHSITAFAVSVPICLSFPALAPAMLFLACSVALSRIMLGMHFLSDVIAGSIIGSLLGYAYFYAFASSIL